MSYGLLVVKENKKKFKRGEMCIVIITHYHQCVHKAQEPIIPT